MKRMVGCICLLFVLFGLIALSAAQAGGFRLACVQAMGGPIKFSQNGVKYQVRMCAGAQKFAQVASASKQYTIHLGLFDNLPIPAKQQSAARLWAFYE